MSKELADFIFEVGHLKRVQRSGWWLAGVEQAESVAEHSFRSAILAFSLAVEEGADPCRAACLALFHDLPEARVGDLHRLAKRYADWDGVEARALDDQVRGLSAALADAVRAVASKEEAGDSPEARIARDADRLECLFQAREYEARGHDVREWMETSESELQTESARALAAEARRRSPAEWCRLRKD